MRPGLDYSEWSARDFRTEQSGYYHCSGFGCRVWPHSFSDEMRSAQSPSLKTPGPSLNPEQPAATGPRFKSAKMTPSSLKPEARGYLQKHRVVLRSRPRPASDLQVPEAPQSLKQDLRGGRDYSDGEMEDGVVATFNDDRGAIKVTDILQLE